jgi:hypothetical protein
VPTIHFKDACTRPTGETGERWTRLGIKPCQDQEQQKQPQGGDGFHDLRIEGSPETDGMDETQHQPYCKKNLQMVNRKRPTNTPTLHPLLEIWFGQAASETVTGPGRISENTGRIRFYGAA